MWKHNVRRTTFCVCVDDFGVKYFTQDDANHLLKAIGASYRYTVDWTGANYCGLTFDWHYDSNYVDIAMPHYISKALKRLNHTPPTFPQHSPHQHFAKRYTPKGTQQFAPPHDSSTLLSPKERRHLQSIVGTLLYYGRAIDYSILPAINDISREQSKATVRTLAKANQVLDYVATHPSPFLRYHASNMVLHCDSDAAYLVAPQSKSRVAGFYHLSSFRTKSNPPPLNGGIHVECKTLRHVVSSAAEAEVAGLFHNAHTILPIRRILHALNHPQPPTPVKTDNSTANGFIHKNIHQKRSKSWDMRFYWLRDKILQKTLKFFWDKGANNNADYFTKHHSTKHHRTIRKKYLHDKIPTPTGKNHAANHIFILYQNLNSICQQNLI